MQKQEFCLLGFTSGTSDKQYKIFVVEESDGTYSAISLYGRRGSLTTKGNIATKTTLVDAMKEARKMEAAKVKKGYSVESTSPGWKTFAAFTTETAATPPPPLGMSQVERELAAVQTEWF